MTAYDVVTKDLQEDLNDVLEGLGPRDLKAYFYNMFDQAHNNNDSFNTEWPMSEQVTLAKLFTKVLDWSQEQ